VSGFLLSQEWQERDRNPEPAQQNQNSATEASLILGYDGTDITADGSLTVAVRATAHSGSDDIV